MILNRSFVALSVSLSLLGLAACASQSPDGSPATVGATESALATSQGTSALELIKQGGTFMFALEESAPAALIREKCAADSPQDKAKTESCYASVRAQADTEGMRFASDAQGHVVWTSFGNDDDGKPAVFIEAPMTMVADGEHAVVATFASAPRGPQLAGETGWATKKLRFELPEANVMVTNDPGKGRLVFHRVQR